MSARAAREHSGPPPGSLRWVALVLISVAMFGNYYVYDSIGPLADSLQKLLGYSDTQIGTLNAIYSFPNIIMVLIGGIIVDRLGTRFATLLFTAVCVVGAILTAVSPSFAIMAAGRLIFGLGAESMIVAITAAIGQWFGDRAARLRLRPEPEHRARRLLRRRHVADLGAAVLRARLAAAALASRQRSVSSAWSRRCSTSSSTAPPSATTTSAVRRRRIASSGVTCCTSTAPTGTSSGSA